jgi:hypothetical protein
MDQRDQYDFPPPRRPKASNMAKLAFYLILFIVVVGLLAVLVGCGDDTWDEYDQTREQIRACAANGGLPQFAQDSDGFVTEYFGCTMP